MCEFSDIFTMDVRANFICGICQKAFTKNSSLKRHKTSVHLSTRYNCLTCPKTYKRREDMIKHSKICLKNSLNKGLDENQTPTVIPSTSNAPMPNAPSEALTRVIQDLTVSDSEEDEELQKMADKLEGKLIQNTVSRQVNTDISNVSTEEKSTQTEPLIVISPDEVLELGEKLSLLTFDKGLKIFVDTLNSDIVFCKPNLARSKNPTTQIGLLAAQPTANRGSQTRDETKDESSKIIDQHQPLSMPQWDLNPTSMVSAPPTRPDAAHTIDPSSEDTSTTTQMDIPITDAHISDISKTPTLEEMCSRKPTRPSLFIPPQKRQKLLTHLVQYRKDNN